MSAPDRPRRTVLITGSTDGLGRATAMRLAATTDVRLLLHGRRRDVLRSVADEVQRASGGREPLSLLADLADLDQVRRLAQDVTASVDRLDVLVNNAGIGFGEPDGVDRRESADGHELRFAVNHLAGFLLTLDLLPLLGASRPARVVDVASVGQNEIDLDDLGFLHGYDGFEAYRRSKLAQIMCGRELASIVDPAEVTFNSVHPATLMPTKIVTNTALAPRDSLESGVDALVRLIQAPALTGRSGVFHNGLEPADTHPQADDENARQILFDRCLALVGRDRPTRSLD